MEFVKNSFARGLEAVSDSEVPTATLQIYQFINEYLVRKPDNNVNRASAASGCPKKRWYQYRGAPADPMAPRAIVNFALGDITEHMVKFFIHEGLCGSGKLYSEVDFGEAVDSFSIQGGKEVYIFSQADLVADIGGIPVTAHVDGWGKRNSDGKWELIEVKSAADYGFEEFKENGPGDYLKQAMVNLQTDGAKARGAQEVRFFYLKKNTGNLWDRLYRFDPVLAAEVVKDYQTAIQNEEPVAPYGPKPETFRSKPTGRRVLKFPCSYCPYIGHCQPAYEIEMKSGRPILVVTESKERVS